MIKKLISTLMIVLTSVAGCCSCTGQSKSNRQQNSNKIMKAEGKALNKDSKKLVVFFSHAGENYNVGNIEKGNTHIIADMIADRVGADRFEIVPARPYPVDYNECIEIAKEEKQAGARPAITGDVKVEDYDLIFIGYPNWWGEVPMAVYTFIEQHDWNGKTVIPFITHEGSGMGGTDRKIAAACKGADVTVGKGLAVQGKVAQTQRDVARNSVDRWLNQFGF